MSGRVYHVLRAQSNDTGNNSYLIIIGLLDDLDINEKEFLNALNQTQNDLAVVTWDWLLENIQKAKSAVEKKLQET